MRGRRRVKATAGTVFVGTICDTPDFTVDGIETWWRTEGCRRYPGARSLSVLADRVGSNGCTPRTWKFALRHRQFSEISKNRAGQPLRSFETILNDLQNVPKWNYTITPG